MSRLYELSEGDCSRLLHAGVFGRIVFFSPQGPEVLPVNYTTIGSALYIRTSASSLLARHGDGAQVAFETDYVNYDRWYGWSVVARGVAECLTEDDLTEEERSMPEPQPWARRGEPLWVRLRWSELTGRRVEKGWDPIAELPVHRWAWARASA